MANISSVSHRDLAVCSCGSDEFAARDVMDAALFRGDLSEPWRQFLFKVAAVNRAVELDLELDDAGLDSAAEQFRYQYDLITAEETEQWLEVRGLSLENFSEYFARQQWGAANLENVEPQDIDYVSAAADDLRETFTVELILSGQLDQMTLTLSWRLAAAAAAKQVSPDAIAAVRKKFFEQTKFNEADLGHWLGQLGRDEPWFDRTCTMEAAYLERCRALLVPGALQREIATARLPLMRFEAEVLQLESRDAAQEALFCVREDGMSMEEVASEGGYPFSRVDFVLEDLNPDVQQKFLGVVDGQVLEPLERGGDGYELCRVVRKVEPKMDDPAIQTRVEQRLLNRCFSELAGKHINFRLTPSR
jgi:hypothetical protein